MSAEVAKNEQLPEPEPIEALDQLPATDHALAARFRFNLVGMMRLAERLVDSMVSSYNNLFRLKEADAAEIYMQLGNNFARSGQSENALAALRRTLELQPDNGFAWFQLGMIGIKEQQPTMAVEAFEKAKAQKLESFELYYHYAEALADLERHEEAASALYAALELQPDSAEAAYRLGLALDQLERYEEAVAAFKLGIAHNPKVVSYYQSLGFTLETMGLRDEAIRYFKLAVNLERRGGV